jgi:conserved oligomeric Golgi complex subunit 3
VETQTIAFQAQCQDVLAEQKRLNLLSDEVGTGLKYYAYLEPVTRRLNAPGASSVIGDDGFVEILTNLDACIKYLITHVSCILLFTPAQAPLKHL